MSRDSSSGLFGARRIPEINFRRVENAGQRLQGGVAIGECVIGALLVSAGRQVRRIRRRKPEVRWRLRQIDLPRHAELQKELLRAAIECVRPGGHVLYAVCSIMHEETTDVIASPEAARGVARRFGHRFGRGQDADRHRGRHRAPDAAEELHQR